MKLRLVFMSLVGLFCVMGYGQDKMDNSLKLWYQTPASRWLEALPIGNGALGAMMYGGIKEDRLAMNISTLWSGGPSNKNNPNAAPHLEKVRKLMLEEKYAEAKEIVENNFLGNQDNYGTHLPMGDFYTDFEHDSSNFSDYHRELDIENAIYRMSYSSNGVNYQREAFASNPDNLIAIRLSSSKAKTLSFVMGMKGGGIPHKVKRFDDKTIQIVGQARENMHSDGQTGVDFEAFAHVLDTDGIVSVKGDGTIHVSKAQWATLIITGDTNFPSVSKPLSMDMGQFKSLDKKTYDGLLKNHTEDYKALFDRVNLNLGENRLGHLPTDKRFEALSKNPDDAWFYSLFYQYGRYLIISGSRENSPLPTNLQGIWNDGRASSMPWTCDFHLDINTQQNYWPVLSGNLAECNEPLFKLLDIMVASGRVTAKEMYGSKGWVAHPVTNAWGYTAPGWGIGWGLHTTGGIWLASHLWEHYAYTKDTEFLRNRAYPILKEAALFFLDYMFEHPDNGWLVTGPSISPENYFKLSDGQPFSETLSPTVDAVLIRDLFTYCINSTNILDVDADFREQLITAKSKLPPLQIGKHGQLQEWLHDREEGVPNHRHTSHLIALYPSEQITPLGTPELARAAKVTLERRISQPDWEDVEWSRANLVNFYTRLQDAEKAYKNLYGLLAENTDMNMMTISRGGIAGAAHNIFAIDGNTAGANGISEMLLQSYDDKIFLLPALPSKWENGNVKGLRTKGVFEVTLEWSDGHLDKLEVLSTLGGTCILVYGDYEIKLPTEAGKSYQLDNNLKLKQ